jgi:hypothetical protein
VYQDGEGSDLLLEALRHRAHRHSQCFTESMNQQYMARLERISEVAERRLSENLEKGADSKLASFKRENKCNITELKSDDELDNDEHDCDKNGHSHAEGNIGGDVDSAAKKAMTSLMRNGNLLNKQKSLIDFLQGIPVSTIRAGFKPMSRMTSGNEVRVAPLSSEAATDNNTHNKVVAVEAPPSTSSPDSDAAASPEAQELNHLRVMIEDIIASAIDFQAINNSAFCARVHSSMTYKILVLLCFIFQVLYRTTRLISSLALQACTFATIILIIIIESVRFDRKCKRECDMSVSLHYCFLFCYRRCCRCCCCCCCCWLLLLVVGCC